MTPSEVLTEPWIERAACRGSRQQPSRQQCARCPVRFMCLTAGFAEPTGRYGGFDFNERRVFLRDARGDRDEALIAAWRSTQATTA